MKFYTYKSKRVHIPQSAEVSGAFLPRGAFSGVVQAALDEIEPWERGEAPCETFDLPKRIGARVVLLDASEQPIWAVNPYHRAHDPGLSPFITLERYDDRGGTDAATLELSGTANKPLLARVYPGEYMPPLPWMKSVCNAPGGMDECLEYWRSHAFILRGQEIGEVGPAPEWYAPPNAPAQP